MQPEQTNNMSGSILWALLIGIDEYLAEQNLRGCVNDVEAMKIFLTDQLSVPEDHIRVLRNQYATRSGIIEAFQSFLINNPDIKYGDQLLVHYSGHGSQMKDHTGVEPDGYNETLVAHDSRTSGIYDIPDKTLAVLLDRLAAQKGNHITVILDSCHSGSGTRKVESPGGARIRRVPADDRLPPADLDADLLAGASTRSAGPSGWSTAGVPYLLLAACRDYEEANEYPARDEAQRVIWHGALTYFTLQHLKHTVPGTTYIELHEEVASRVNAEYPSQMPQCEGDRHRVLFGGMRVQRDAFITVQRVEGDTITLGAGLVHGLRQGTELALYPPHVRTRSDLPPEPLATITVTSVTATTAQARLQRPATHPISLHARGLITKQVYVGLRQTVALPADAGEADRQAIERLRQAIHHATPDGQPSPYLQLQEAPDGTADLRVVATDGKLSLYNANDELLVSPEAINESGGDVLAVLHSLQSIARYRAIQDLANYESGSQLAGKVKLGLRRYGEMSDSPKAEDLPADAIGPGGELTLTYDADQEEHNKYVVDVINNSSLRIYPHVLILNPDYSIDLLYPQLGQQEALRPGGTLPIGLGNRQELLEVYLPDEPRWDISQDRLKVIATTQPTDLKVLEQRGLNVPPPSRGAKRSGVSPLDLLIDTVTSGSGLRYGRRNQTLAGEDWVTAELRYIVRRAFPTKALDAPASRVALSDGIVLIKPEGFRGQVTVTTWGQATRGADGDPALKPPPGLDGFPELFQPIRRTGTRSLGPAGLVIAFDVDDMSRRSITPDNPLRLALPSVEGEAVAEFLPVAFDGEDYLLVGSSADAPDTVEVVNLPLAATSSDAQDRPATRGLGRTIRLFIYKKIGRYTPLMGIHRAEVVSGEVVYNNAQREQFSRSNKVALFIHGLGSDSRWMVKVLGQFLRREAINYDHFLTWDYEMLGTTVKDSGEQLALALRQRCGFGPDDGITLDVYSHGMGSLVARCMIELSGGHRFVDRLIMAGPPNRGTTLATSGRGLVYLLNALINNFSSIPLLGGTKDVLKKLYQQGASLADLIVDSPIVQQLNSLEQPANVPYLVLAGENVLHEQVQHRLRRLAQKVLDTTLDAVFGEQNDIAVGISSMQGVRGGAYPHLKVAILPCDHFHYFDIPQSLEAIKQWMIGA
jgi:pimeloyl-ACP methyl ester carboxylesterase